MRDHSDKKEQRERFRQAHQSARWHSLQHPRRRRPKFVFSFFAFVFGLIPLLIVAGIIILVLNPPFVWDMGMMHHRPDQPIFQICAAAALLPMAAVFLAGWARRRVAKPLGGIMEAAESVTDGDLSVRVEEHRGPFSHLERTFNRMLVELERTDQQRRNLTADVAHELNTPLHIIQGYLEGIADGIYPPDETTINILLDETQLLARLVEDLRTLSLAEGGELHLQQEHLSVQELLTDLKTSFSGQSEEAGVQLEVSAPADLNVFADPNRLDQILGNLVANALRHTPSGGEIRIQARSVDDGMEIEVSDTGEGIAAEDLPYVFNRFWRKDKSRERTKGGGGHGLGLAIAQQLVHAHGGEIGVESEVGTGTTFIVWLPE